MRTIVLNRYNDIIYPLLASLEKFRLSRGDVIVVRDSHTEDYGYAAVPGIEPFVFSRNVNIGIKLGSAMDRVSSGKAAWTGGYSNVFLLNDDCRIEQEDFFSKLKSVTESLPKKVGILGALVDGGVGNPMQRYPCQWGSDDLYFVPQGIPVNFVAAWLRGKMLDEIGLLDESLVHYGFDDDEMCDRARKAGWSCALSSQLWVRHGSGGAVNIRGENWSKSSARVDPEFKRDNSEILRRKQSAISPAVAKLALK